jgi:penicillin-binding protein 1A
MLPCEYTANERAIFPDYDDWSPRNADGKYEGVYSMEGALSRSVNTVSVALLQRGGMDSTALLARQMGIEGPIQPVPSMALGTTDASLWEMVTVFATIAAQGRRPVLHLLDRIETASGEVILEVRRPNPSYFQPVLDPQQSAVITRMLESVVDSGTARRLRSVYRLRGSIAGKTGTTQEQTDGWFLGFTPQLVAGAWVGAESPRVHFRSLRYGQGANTALPIWARFYQKAYANRSTRRWLAGDFVPPSDSMLSFMMCPPYLEEMPVLADLWPDYRDNPGFFSEWQHNGRFSGSDYQIRLKPRRPDETDEEYFRRMEKYNQRKFKREERKRKRRDYWSRVFFGKEKREENQ